jgi:hypothetical protein
MTSVFGVPRQIAYAVPDLSAATMDSFASTTGAGPFVVAEHVELSRCDVGGRPGEFDHSSAYGQWGDVMVELIVEHQTCRIGPTIGVHHVAFMVDSLERAIAHCEGAGWPVALDASTKHGQRFVMCDARSDLGHLVELYEPSPALVAFYAHVRRLADGPSGANHDATGGGTINP